MEEQENKVVEIITCVGCENLEAEIGDLQRQIDEAFEKGKQEGYELGYADGYRVGEQSF